MAGNNRRNRSNRNARRDPRRRRRLAVVLGGLALVVVLAAVLVFSPLLQVRSIEVEGTERLAPEDVIAAASSVDGQNLLFADTDEAAQSVSALPWVEKVTVSRDWPSSVRVQVTEFEAVGVVDGDSDGPLVINERGRVFLRGESPEGAVPVRASADDSAALTAAGEALAALPAELRDQVEELEASSAEELTLRFPEGREVYWGSADRADEKAEATRVVLTREGDRWNVSNPAMPSVRE
ncbi:cell division protein FtsQ/DivIB [Corynebacterium sp. AOP40-9SA-29]|uniref:cell division protein FtsQ/DivIB n=1 Tax=Corynebacterium sp. AOP40-9SA-29 TaxID=3457677 RepID=UPI0040349172